MTYEGSGKSTLAMSILRFVGFPLLQSSISFDCFLSRSIPQVAASLLMELTYLKLEYKTCVLD